MMPRLFITLCNADCHRPARHTVVYQRGLQVLCAVCHGCGHAYLDDTEAM